MPNGGSQLQQDEVIAFVSTAREKACAIVHPPSKREAVVFASEPDWGVRIGGAAPSASETEVLRRLGLSPTTRELHMRFGPRAGQTITIHQITGEFPTVQEAASSALAGMRLLVGTPHGWLWVTEYEYDDRGEPPAPPHVWPPSAGT